MRPLYTVVDEGVPGGLTVRGPVAFAGSFCRNLLTGSSTRSPLMDLTDQLQRTLGDGYTLERELGGGGMSRVFVAEERALGRKVVVKVLPPDTAAQVSIERFKREILLAARLQHPHIVPLLTAGDSEGLPYFTMPLIEGESLRARLARHGELPVNEAMRVLREIASALAYAHERGIVHRDIKPDNVLVSGGSAMVTDFGVAKALSASSNSDVGGVTSLGIALGTPAYMAPEQASADPNVDHRADIYAFGILAYELLTGQPPFTGRTPQNLLAAHVTESPEPIGKRRASLPPALAGLVMRCLEKRPADRIQSAKEIVHALDDITTPSGGMQPTSAIAATAARAGDATAGTERVPFARSLRVAIIVTSMAMLAAGYAAWRALPHDAAAGAGTSGGAGGGAMPKSVAVLPLVTPAGDTANVYFAQGMTDEVTGALGRVKGLRVASRSAATSVDMSKPVDVRAVGTRLNVGAVLEGQMRRSGSKFRVTMQLTNVADGLSLWSDSFDGELKDAFTVQDKIARAIASALSVALAGNTRLVTGTTNTEAHDLVLRGRFEVGRFTDASLRQAVTHYQRATELDPTYADAWAGLAEAWFTLADDFMVAKDAVAPGRAALARAVAIDSLNPAVLAQVGAERWWYGRDARAATVALERALAIDSLNESAILPYISLLDAQQQFDSAATLMQRAWRANPYSITITSGNLRSAIRSGHADAADRQCSRAIALDSAQFGTCRFGILWNMGKLPEALAACRAWQPAPSMCGAKTLGRLGRRAEALKEAALVETSWGAQYIRPNEAAAMWAWAGDLDRAMKWLDREERNEGSSLSYLATVPLLEPLHGDPRFEAMVKRVARK